MFQHHSDCFDNQIREILYWRRLIKFAIDLRAEYVMTSAKTNSEQSNPLSASGQRDRIRFLRRDSLVEIRDFRPSAMVLEYLREECGATGTKEGCAEGDCGACTIVVGTRSGDRIDYRAVNSCIQPLGSLDGKELITVEDLADESGLNPVQDAMVELHGSQCGFCTPGFVMALFALLHRDDKAPLTRQRITDAIAGNLCRCTGYRSIVDAAFAACNAPQTDQFGQSEPVRLASLEKIEATDDVFVGSKTRFFASPASEDSLAALFQQHPDATLVAGSTDVGLWITKQMREIDKIIYLGNVRALSSCEAGKTGIEIGAACTFTNAFDALKRLDPDIGEVLRRLGSDQIRNAGTIGGNIANGSPIGDTPPILIALGAKLELRLGDHRRTIPLEEFFIEYGKQDRAPSEFVRKIHVPNLKPTSVFRCYKIAKRFDQDISSVLGAFHFNVEDGVIKNARIAFGGMAGTPCRASQCEQALIGLELRNPNDWAPALVALSADYTPMSDHRASADYRNRVACALLEKALIEASDSVDQTRLVGLREAVHV